MKTLETKRLILRRWQIDDADDLYEYAKDPRVGPMAGWKPHVSKEESLNTLKYYIDHDDGWAIMLKENKKVIGSIALKPDENRGKYNAKSISFALSADYWGNGYMTEAVKRIIKYAFEEINIDLLSVWHYPHNFRSKRVIEKCGFQYEGIIKQGSQIYDGRKFDSICYSILKSEYCSETSTQPKAYR